MPSDKVKIYAKLLGFGLPYFGRVALQRVSAYRHRFSWENTPNAKNVVVLGGSFAGFNLINRLTETLPTGYKVVWIEKNSHLNYSFNFPRYSVLTGHEHLAFIPYDGIAKGAPPGIITRIQDKAIAVTKEKKIVQLASGDSIGYEYLASATGSSQPLPVQVTSTEYKDACRELQGIQATIKESQKITIIGGGAVGVQLASDIKDFYPSKEVTLIHSRDRLLNHFGKRLGHYVLNTLENRLHVRVLLNQRPEIPSEIVCGLSVKLSDGCEEQFDLVIRCTGQQPNSAIQNDSYPNAIAENSRIRVRPTLQVFESTDIHGDLPIFALGDVADHCGPRMGRAGLMQSGIVLDNMLAKIHRKAANHTYNPIWLFEGATIKLTLGKTHQVIYAMDNDGSDYLIAKQDGKPDLDVEEAWKLYGVDFKKASKNVD